MCCVYIMCTLYRSSYYLSNYLSTDPSIYLSAIYRQRQTNISSTFCFRVDGLGLVNKLPIMVFEGFEKASGRAFLLKVWGRRAIMA